MRPRATLSVRPFSHQSGLGVVGVVAENLAPHQLPGDDVRNHNHPVSFAFSRDALPQIRETFDPNGQFL